MKKFLLMLIVAVPWLYTALYIGLSVVNLLDLFNVISSPKVVTWANLLFVLIIGGAWAIHAIRHKSIKAVAGYYPELPTLKRLASA